jgi:hypothetical protein
MDISMNSHRETDNPNDDEIHVAAFKDSKLDWA